MVFLVIRFDSHVNKEVSANLRWAIPFQLILLYIEGLYVMLMSLMKCFNYIWLVTIWSTMNDFLMCLVAFYLSIVKGMYFKGSVMSTSAYAFGIICFGVPWYFLIFDLNKDIYKVDFEEEDAD